MKRLFVALFVVLVFASTALAVSLYDGEGNRIGEVVSKGLLDNGKWGVQVFVESLGKFARISVMNSRDGLHADIIDRAPHGWGGTVSDSVCVWEGMYFTTGSERYADTDIYPYSEMSGLFIAKYCPECADIFPIKLPLRYEVSN